MLKTLQRIFNKIGFVPLYIRGTPNSNHNKIGFLSEVAFAPSGQFGQAIENVAKSLHRPSTYKDKDGYEIEIISAAIHTEFNWKAWIESRQKNFGYDVDIKFTLKIMKDEQITHTWMVETYNPYFGCRVGYMQWYGEYITTVYREKHNTYICSIGSDYQEQFISVSDNWIIKDDICYFIDDGDVGVDTNIRRYVDDSQDLSHVSEELRQFIPPPRGFGKIFSKDQVERIALPDLTILPPLTKPEAKALGVLTD
jgi:hypothetical protein